ncbi:PKD domain-containing protein [Halobacterium litoreum]|uniref:PKD domain-containing protein n=1 Tax=Halobacterium litoreum TaxID=2039234 RepID=A0ABD5NCE9_9EURY|nr:PKD domain-containing protein [Halobacterium litoreum]UHH14307.1 PKD domain-containing protein [Halobacterium litoreum]
MNADWLLALLVLSAAATTPGIATTNDPPLADAGLDQTTTRGTTVYLDGGGSRDPDGTVTDYDWTVTAPNGTTTEPNCGDCQRTRFRATSVGTYEVTLTVTGADGATATDTLYVTAEPGAPPDAAVAGPTRLETGATGTFTADLAAGAAPLDRAVWYVDGERRATTALDGRAATPDLDVRFPTTGTHDVRVVAVDADDQRTTATRTVTVTDPSDSTVDSPTSDPAADDAHTIDGPRVVTGDGALDATYRLDDGTGADWYLDDRRVDTGDTATLTLTPGTHELYAVPHDGSGAAVFPDGSRTVVADPEPNVHLGRTTNESVVTVDAYATDGLGNLRSLSVLVDGEPKRTVTTGGIERASGDGHQLTLLERLAGLEPGRHALTVRARDARGQVDAETRRIHVPGPPEVVSAGFVEDGPLDVYHPRLNTERYTATYQMKVDLNGVNPEYIEPGYATQRDGIVENGDWRRSQSQSGHLTFQRDFMRHNPGEIGIKSVVEWQRGSSTAEDTYNEDAVLVTTAKPIIRLELVESENRRQGFRGAWFDASDSFDPDGSELSYTWIHTDDGRDVPGPIGKLDVYDRVKLNVTDEQGETTTTYKILHWFVPDLAEPVVDKPGPYFPNESVTYTVKTNTYELAKQRYQNDTGGDHIDFGLRTDVGNVTGHNRVENEPGGGEGDNPDDDSAGASYIYHEWDVSVPAHELLDGQPNVTIYATDSPQATRTVSLPKPALYEPLNTYSNVTDMDVQYLEERDDHTVRKTSNPTRKDALEAQGYDVYRTSRSGTAYHLEKRTKTQSAAYDTRQREFANEMGRKLFLGANPTWSSAGSEMRVREWTETDTVWRNSRTGGGEFTGDTRRTVVDPAEYRTEWQFRYEERVAYETTEHYQYTVEWTETETVTRENCLPGLGCREYKDTITVTHSKTYEGERQVTKYRDETRTYWSQRPKNPAHDKTGARRSVKVENADYERQYEYSVTTHHERTERTYLASKTVQTQSAEYEWLPYETVESDRAKLIYTSNADVRVGETEPTKQWMMRLDAGTSLEQVSDPANPSNVVRTSVTATVELRTRLRSPSSGQKGQVQTQTREITVEESADVFLTTEESKNFISNHVNESDVGYE